MLKRWGTACVILGAMIITAGRVEAALLTAAHEAQLEAWLGEGDLDFTSIFIQAAGDGQNTLDFHDAADGQGRTFTLIRASTFLGAAIIGGYNPRSWDSISGQHLTPTDAERTAFIFNLTLGDIQRQKLTSHPSGPTTGQIQTTNNGAGIEFGGGDLQILFDFSLLQIWQNSYGPTVHGTNVVGGTNFTFGSYSAVEVYTIAPAASTATPEPASLAIWGLGAVGMAVSAARRRRKYATG